MNGSVENSQVYTLKKSAKLTRKEKSAKPCTKVSAVSSAQELQRIPETAKTGMPRAIDNLVQISIRFRVCNVSVDSHSKRLFYVFRYSSHACIGMYTNIVGTLVVGINIGF